MNSYYFFLKFVFDVYNVNLLFCDALEIPKLSLHCEELNKF